MQLRHTMILASAGSGKTYALTNRFVALLAAGAAPERIVALTFTRKAAGEFFAEILQKLARAASEDTYARELARQLDRPDLGRADFLKLLRLMVDGMHRLRLGTLDSFFAGVARAFPLELGLTGDFEVLQEHAARLERQRILRGLFARDGDLDDAQAEFIEAFKRATFGTEEKRLGARLDAFLDQYQENFLAAPEAALWGDPRRIWPEGTRWFDGSGELDAAVGALRTALVGATDGQRVRWENFFSALREWTPGAPLSPPMEYILKNALAVWDQLCDGTAEMTVERRKMALTGGACGALHQIITHIVGAELRRHLEVTRGIFAVLRGYEAHYHDRVRRAGRLTFADVQRLLEPVTLSRAGGGARNDVAAERSESDEEDPGSGGQLDLRFDAPARLEAGAEERRLMIDYRLDAEIDHWLLDEFQDTSFGQWSVLRNLIDEVVQDPEGRRSFFCVGDVKQAIYAWREGDPRLFREIFNHYNAAAPGVVVEQHLIESWRSGPALIDMVNAVFGSAPVLTELFPGEASTVWNREWRAHRSALPQRTGQAALLHAADEAERWVVTLDLLREIRPLERGLSCVVLVRKNDTAAALADFLRRSGIAAIAESDLAIATDNPLGASLLALLKAAAHPGDTLAQEHLRMTPLGDALREQGAAAPEALTARVLGQIHGEGFEPTVAYWTAQLEPRLALDDAFSRQRAREFAAAAGAFDALGGGDVDEFIAYMERYVVRPPESAAIVRVMTVHKSKGLGFDVVILPDLQGNRIDERRDGLAVQKAADRSVSWVLDLPPRLFCGQDEVLSGYLRSAEADACYESLSLLYVALTRAKRAMYVITEPVGDSKSRNFPRLLAETLGEDAREVRVGSLRLTGAWASGDPEWHAAITPAPATGAPAAAALQPLDPATGPSAGRRAARRPSSTRRESVGAGVLFSLESAGAAEFGTALHALLAEVEWLQAEEIAARVAAWRRKGHAEPVVAAAESCLRSPALSAVWRPPVGAKSEVWRERSFEIVLDGVWVTGVFDRVVVERRGGRVSAVTVFDFKTDRVSGERDIAGALERYAEQLGTYRRVAAVLTGMSATEIRCDLVFTHVGRRVEVPMSRA